MLLSQSFSKPGIITLSARVESEDEKSRLIAESLISFSPLSELDDKLKELDGKGVLRIVLRSEQVSVEKLKKLKVLLKQHKGPTPVEFTVHLDGSIYRVLLPNSYWVSFTAELQEALFSLFQPHECIVPELWWMSQEEHLKQFASKLWLTDYLHGYRTPRGFVDFRYRRQFSCVKSRGASW